MSKKYEFSAVIEGGDQGGAYVTIPFDVEQAFGKKRVKVRAHIEGIAYQGSLVRMGGPDHILIILKEIREKLGKVIGDIVQIILEEDEEPREVMVPKDLQNALIETADGNTFFQQLSYTHKREYVKWIEEAKKADTRQRRIEKTIEMLKARQTR